jgi:hypothetical protein
VEDVRTLVEGLESRGVRFYADADLVRFDYDWRTLEPGDPARIGEVIMEREHELREFLARRAARPTSFGAYAAVFRSFTYRFRTPAGMLLWLRERCPMLYADLTGRLPDAVQRLWEEGAPMEEFTRAIRSLEEAQSCAVSFYEACREGEGWTGRIGSPGRRRRFICKA